MAKRQRYSTDIIGERAKRRAINPTHRREHRQHHAWHGDDVSGVMEDWEPAVEQTVHELRPRRGSDD